MKLFDLDARPRQELRQRKQQQKEFKLIGTMKHRAGHILFSINTRTGEVKEAEYVKKSILTWAEALNIFHGGIVKRNVQIEKDCVYIEAMNKENAMKKYRKML